MKPEAGFHRLSEGGDGPTPRMPPAPRPHPRVPLAILAARALMAAFPTQAEASRPSQEPVGIGDEAAQSLTMEDLPDFAAVSDSAGGIPRQASPLTIIPTRPRPEVVRYVVQSGDTLFGIADRFGLRPETLLWGNYEVLQDNPHSLRPGQETAPPTASRPPTHRSSRARSW